MTTGNKKTDKEYKKILINKGETPTRLAVKRYKKLDQELFVVYKDGKGHIGLTEG